MAGFEPKKDQVQRLMHDLQPQLQGIDLKRFSFKYGGSPSIISIAIIPKDHMSTLGPYCLRVTTSGAIQYGVPTIVVRLDCSVLEELLGTQMLFDLHPYNQKIFTDIYKKKKTKQKQIFLRYLIHDLCFLNNNNYLKSFEDKLYCYAIFLRKLNINTNFDILPTSIPVEVSIAVYTVPDALKLIITINYEALTNPCPIFSILVYFLFGSPTVTIVLSCSNISLSATFLRLVAVVLFLFLSNTGTVPFV
ncbi:hypothetical protein AGLY_008329 [Aphis glycines]|uniref:Uncharacterized protein n=1 Tax=Aphis glycines TaxID=307491 RepID=A0A6G0TM34_APHGL|nr:hypothetical protein AGLY_008329 [Aphis glycines]